MTDFSLQLRTDETTGSIHLIYLSIYSVHSIQLCPFYLQYAQQLINLNLSIFSFFYLSSIFFGLSSYDDDLTTECAHLGLISYRIISS